MTLKKRPALGRTRSAKLTMQRLRAQINVMSVGLYTKLPIETRMTNLESLVHGMFNTLYEFGLYNYLIYSEYRKTDRTNKQLNKEVQSLRARLKKLSKKS